MKRFLLLLAVCAALSFRAHAQQNTALTIAFDQLLKKQFPANDPGATVLVSRQGKILYQKAFGMANTEL
ncbi:MAG: D-alanyl-D-alanine carboxypeptidase, partial [Chitinophagaceae bacterium]